MSGADVSILLTVLNDPRGVRTLESLCASDPLPLEAVVADGGSRPDLLAPYHDFASRSPFPVRIEDVPGSVAASREAAWSGCRGDIVAFLDADEVATPAWLGALTKPLREGAADFAAGPTEPLSVSGRWDRYHAALDAWFYRNYVARDVVYAPMGNTAWHRRVFQALAKAAGHVFDVGLARGGEDFDVTIRAIQAGFRGRYVPGAVARHDYSAMRSLRRTLRKKRNYAVAEFQLKRRHAEFFRRRPLPPAEPKPNRWHPVEVLEPWVRWRAARAARRLP